MEQAKIKHVITFLPTGIQFEAVDGCTLLEAQIQAGLKPTAFCGGNGTCGKCLLDLHRKDGVSRVKACDFHIHEPLTVELLPENQLQDRDFRILAAGDWTFTASELTPDQADCYVAACDLGTTTIVVYLLDGTTGKLLAAASDINPQTHYSADLIGRISYALEHGSEKLTMCVRDMINTLLEKACAKAGIPSSRVSRVCLAGNCCMHHLFLGLPVSSLAVIPYSPAITDALELPASECGLSVCSEGILQVLPNIAGFVGADTAACLNTAGFDTLTELTLLLDIGTNGELVLGDQNRRIACSAAAGPAFEGARIACGMPACKGAIDHVWLEDGKIRFSVIGQDENPAILPLGICGSGLIDAVSVFLETGILDSSGRFLNSYCRPDAPAYAFSDTVFLTQKDIRELQLAKAAIAAGIQLLCEQLGITPDQIQRVLLAGAFGNYLNPASACKIGLIPEILKERITSVGNAAGIGACRCACSREEFERTKKLAAETEFLELAGLKNFQDAFVENLNFEKEI